MKKRLSILIGWIAIIGFYGFAQDYDDVYYNSSKNKTTKKSAIEKIDDYNSIENMRDVDEYNRRYSTQDSIMDYSMYTENQGDFTYTDRIRRFHNATVIIETDNPDVAEVYYVSNPSNVNLVIGTPTNYWDPYWNDWCYPSYYSWHTRWYGSSWHPWYDWTFTWNWGYPMYHHYHHFHHYPYWTNVPPHHGHGVKPHKGNIRPTYNAGSRRPNTGSYSGGKTNSGRRPVVIKENSNTSVNRGDRPNVNKNTATGNKSGGRRPNINKNNDDTRKSSQDSYFNRGSSNNSRRSGFSTGGGRSRGGVSGGRTGRR